MIWTLLLAAGKGQRLAEATGGIAKQFLEDSEGLPLYWRSVVQFSRCARLNGIIFVFPEEMYDQESRRVALLMQRSGLGLNWRCTVGGALRQDSVCAGLACLPDACRYVLVHDAARPFFSPFLTNRILDVLLQHGVDGQSVGVVPGISVTDTIKEVADGKVCSTPDRDHLIAVQTPQGFDRMGLQQAHARAIRESWIVTDDASLFERSGFPVYIVDGEAGNKKLTRAEDLAMLERNVVSMPRTGFGYDVHKYALEDTTSRQPARPMKLGGIFIPEGPEVYAHSDGDVVLHALADALLGCAGLGDIGQLFPDSRPEFDNMDSAVLLDDVLDRIRKSGLQPVHVDITIIAQIPRITPYRESIHRNITRLLQLPPEHVNIKATTEEGLGFTGAGQGMKAVAVVTAR